MRSIRVPFLQCRNAVKVGEWQLHTAGERVPLPEMHPAWDAGVDVHVSTSITLGAAEFMAETGLAAGSMIRLVAGFECELARSRSFPWRRSVRLPSSFHGELEVDAPAARLAQRMDFIVGAVLIAAAQGSSRAAARMPGSWLWMQRVPLLLQGAHGRFPTEWIAFKKSGYPPEAVWMLDWPSQDWASPALGSLRMLLNSDNPSVQKILELPEKDARRQLFFWSARMDVAKQLVVAALTSPDFFDPHEQFDEGSVGDVVTRLMNLAFPDEDPRTLRELLVHHAGDFHGRLQHGLGALDVEITE